MPLCTAVISGPLLARSKHVGNSFKFPLLLCITTSCIAGTAAERKTAGEEIGLVARNGAFHDLIDTDSAAG